MTTERQMYLDYFNNFLTVEAFAIHYQVSIDDAKRLISEQRDADENLPVSERAIRKEPPCSPASNDVDV